MKWLTLTALCALVALGCSNTQAVVGGRLDAESDVANDLTVDTADVTDTPDAREVRCGASQQNCAGVCVDLASDRTNCGACGLLCGGRQVCVAGSCQDSCPPGQITCNGTCVNPLTNRESCGSCGNQCTASQV